LERIQKNGIYFFLTKNKNLSKRSILYSKEDNIWKWYLGDFTNKFSAIGKTYNLDKLHIDVKSILKVSK